jgi:hypothetical protein
MEEVLQLYHKLYNSGNITENECHFILEYVICESDYNKWFYLLGTNIQTNEKTLIPIRNNVIDTFVENNWKNWYDSHEIDQWDFYKELAANKVPMIWKPDGEYMFPNKFLNRQKWKRLDWHMKHINQLSSEGEQKRDIYIYI